MEIFHNREKPKLHVFYCMEHYNSEMVLVFTYRELSELFFYYAVKPVFCFWYFKKTFHQESSSYWIHSMSLWLLLDLWGWCRGGMLLISSMTADSRSTFWREFCNCLLLQRHEILLLFLHLDWGGLKASAYGRLRVSKLWSVQRAQDFISTSPCSDLFDIS